jgi:hypothetical protein
MKTSTQQPSKSQLLAEITFRQQQVAAIEEQERKDKALQTKQRRLECQRALLVAINTYDALLKFQVGADEWALSHHLMSARALLERSVKEELHA